MILRRISHHIALQFSAFVFLFFLINGLFFFTADFSNTQRQMQFRMERMAEKIAMKFESDMTRLPVIPRGGIPLNMREQIRILDEEGNILSAGSFFENLPFEKQNPMFASIDIDDEEYVMFTVPFEKNGRNAGFIQIADSERFSGEMLNERIILYLVVSIIVSATTYVIGLYFARRSLRPAQEMMDRLEQFSQDASHEIRTPLAALNSSLDLALKTKQYQKGIAEAKEDVKQISQLVERLLELTRLDAFMLEKESLDLSGLVTHATERITPLAASKGIVLHSEIVPNVSIKGDPALIRQIVANLLSNAIKFSKQKGGIVTVRLTDDTLSVEDDGIGITKEDLPHVFQRFFQADHSRGQEGLGLGLALVQRIVQLHGWKISVNSTKGSGAIFTVTFQS